MSKRMTLYDKVLSLLPDTLMWSQGIDITAAENFLLEADGLPRIFLGSGGSLSAAQLAMQLSVENGIVAAAMTPYQYICSAWSRLPAKVVIISAGGRNIDAINAFKTAYTNPQQKVSVIMTSTATPLEQLMDETGENAKFIYPLKNRDGFLATNSLLAFYSLLLRIYRNDSIEITDWSFTETIGKNLREFIGRSYTLTTENWDSHNAALYDARETDRFYVLYSPDTMPVAVDLESRFSEGSVGCLQISDYRNFAHGRFNWFHQRKGQTAIIAIVSAESSKVANDILKELPAEIPLMRLTTDLTGSAATIELLIKSMYLARYLGERWGLDIGAPKVADFGRIIHRMDFID
ncbi:MAG: hypothetical protein K2H47_09380 [Muribaculaceae bacterium]|nr:hypothetical protein [Muribaculaceae bacterium]